MPLYCHSKTSEKNVPALLFAWLIFSQAQLFFVYTCSMRDALKNVFGKELILDNGNCYLYTIQPYEMKNVLGAVVALLDEYSFTKKGTSETFKLYRTNEGNWYDLTSSESSEDYRVLRGLKAAFDNMQNATT